MIIVNVNGPSHRQLGQYAFGLACAAHLQTCLKLDLSSEPSLLDSFGFEADIASATDIAAAKKTGVITETTPLFDSSIWNRLFDGAYLEGDWIDHRHSDSVLPSLMASLDLRTELSQGARGLRDDIRAKASVSLDLRPGHAVPPAIYFNDAIAEMHERVPGAHLFVLCEDAAAVPEQYALGEHYTLIAPASALCDAEAILLMSACRHHIVGSDGASFWAARLDPKADGIVIAPQQLYAPPRAQPVWPAHWMVFPTRLVKQREARNPAVEFKGGSSINRPMRVAVQNFYEAITTDGFLFKNVQTTNGHNLLKPWCDLHDYGAAHGIEFVTLDQVANIATDVDAVVFMDRPKDDNALANAALAADIVKILIVYECPLIKPDGWDTEYHQRFDRVFTWGDQLTDGRRYIKNNFTSDTDLAYDFEVLKSAFDQRKLATMINSAVLLQNSNEFPTELYTHRVRSIRWFEANAPQDFDLYGMGWKVDMFPSYKGKVRDKLAALSHYRFAICYENAMSYPGYITEKIQDCLLAGVVPVYGGAPNIARWIPSDCYIDIGSFQSYEALHAHLAGMDADTHGQYLDRIRQFFTSGAAYPFSSECFITTLTKYLAWDVQTKRGDIPELALELANGANGQTHCLVQDLETMQVNVVPREASAPAHVPSTPASIRQAMTELKRDDLIICLGYGPELGVFLRARALWQFYAAHFPNIKVIFFRDTDTLPRGEVVSEGDDLVIGSGTGDGNARAESAGYAQTGVWSATQNERTIFRQMALYDYLLRKYDKHFFLYTATITSVVDFRGLTAILDSMPRSRCFAGMLGTLVHAPYQGVGMVHGANTLISRDVMELMRSRYVAGHEYTKQPNDHWQGLVLPDVARTALPLFSLNQPRRIGDNLDDIATLISQLVRDGHYHFRVKTSSEQTGLGAREDIDPWIMLKVMEAILSTPSSPEKNKSLQQRFARCCEPAPNYPRDFPIDDSETGLFYPPASIS